MTAVAKTNREAALTDFETLTPVPNKEAYNDDNDNDDENDDDVDDNDDDVDDNDNDDDDASTLSDGVSLGAL